MIFSLSTDDSLKCVLITNIREKIKSINNKIKLNKAQGNLGGLTKLLRFLLYHEEVLINMKFYLPKTFHQLKTWEVKIWSTVKILLFTGTLKNLLNVLFDSKRNNLVEFKNILELFYNDTEEIKIKLNKEYQEKIRIKKNTNKKTNKKKENF